VKAALEASVRYAAAELGEKGIRVFAVSPGPLKTRAASRIAHFDAMILQERAAGAAGAPAAASVRSRRLGSTSPRRATLACRFCVPMAETKHGCCNRGRGGTEAPE
jgi:enoyl-[acyl-carrier protein] reductase I